LKRGVSEDDGDVIQSQRRREIERLRLDREIEDRQKNLAIRDPKGRDATHLGERRRLESLKQQRKELGASEKPVAPMTGRSDADEAKSKAPFSAQFNQEQEIEALRRKITVLQDLSVAATNARDKMAFLADTIPVTRRLEKAIAPNAVAANRFKLGKTGAGETNERPEIPKGPAKFALGGPATAGGTGGEGAGATPSPKEVTAKWKNVAKASAEDLKAAFNIDLGINGMTAMERLAAGITSGASRVDSAAEAVGNGVKTKVSSVDLTGPTQQMMAGWAGAITAGGAQVVAATEAVAARVRSAAAAGVAGGLRTASARSTSSAAQHDGVA
jgi:hypothetical protein